MSDRIGDWIQTFTGRKFWPLDPRREDIEIRDIAHALSMQCRYAGHCKRFYSVAEHCVLLSRWMLAQGHGVYVARWALLHDASEAYILDIPRPLKPYLTNYRDIETGVMKAVEEAFALYGEAPKIVKQADDRILADEKAALLQPLTWGWEPGPPLGIDIRCWPAETAEREFLDQFDRVAVLA